MKVYLVEDTDQSPGKIYGIFTEYDAAYDLMHALYNMDVKTNCYERSLIYGQAPTVGYNP